MFHKLAAKFHKWANEMPGIKLPNITCVTRPEPVGKTLSGGIKN